MIEKGQAGGQLAASRARPGDHDDRFLRGDIFVGAVTLFADDQIDVRRIALGELVGIDADAAPFQLVFENGGRRLLLVAGDDHGAHLDAPFAQVIDELERIGIIGDAEIRADLLALDVAGVDAQDHIHLVAQLLQQAHLDVRIKSGKDARGMKIPQELAAEFQIQFVVEFLHAPEDGLGLLLEIVVIVETDLERHVFRSPLWKRTLGAGRALRAASGRCRKCGTKSSGRLSTAKHNSNSRTGRRETDAGCELARPCDRAGAPGSQRPVAATPDPGFS